MSVLKLKDFIINESKNEHFCSFNYDDNNFEFIGKTKKELYSKVIEWLYKSGYKFENDSIQRKLLSEDDVKSWIKKSAPYNGKNVSRLHLFYNIEGTDRYVITNFIKEFQDLIFMLEDFGATDIKFDKSMNDYNENDSESETNEKLTFVEAAQICLQNNNNRPMSADEIWKEISDSVEYITNTPIASLNTILGNYSENSNYKFTNKKKIFRIVSQRPAKYVLISPKEIHPISDNELEETEKEVQKASDVIKTFQKNPFGGDKNLDKNLDKKSSAICVLGKSGDGKSYTIEEILSKEGHEYEIIIPTSSTTGLLSQYSPPDKKYKLSKLGKLLIKAQENPDKLYTAVFDECHKIVDMINDELLQAISLKRNKFRFITLDTDTDELYSSLESDRGRRKIPDNFGFIFISSKPDIMKSNEDFASRVDFIEFTKEDRTIETISELLTKISNIEDV